MDSSARKGMIAFAALPLLVLSWCTPSVNCNCALYGCTLSLSYTCPMDFYEGSFYPELAMSFEDDHLLPTGAGCATNHERILCPLAGNGTNMMIAWNIASQYASWNVSTEHLVTLPSVDVSGSIYFCDGYALYGYDDVGDPLGPKIVMHPVTGPLFDMTVVSGKFLYLLYKSGFMVAYFTTGSPYASIWLNTTVDGQDGTFIPLSNPAVSGERVYIITKFVPAVPKPPGTHLTLLRLYAIDVRTVMVGRIKVIWYHDYNLSAIPVSSCRREKCGDEHVTGTGAPSDEVARVIVHHSSVVVAMVNYVIVPRSVRSKCADGKCKVHGRDSNRYSGFHSLMISVDDEGDSYRLNFISDTLPPFQAVAYVSPNFTVAKCRHTKPVPPPEIWVSWIGDDSYSVISTVNIKTGTSTPKIKNLPSLVNITLTSKITIFYNDQQNDNCMEKNSGVLMPLVFGYTTSDGGAYVAAIDVSNSEQPDLRWSQQLPGNVPALGQVTTAGIGRDTMMMVTTSRGVYFYVLFSDELND